VIDNYGLYEIHEREQEEALRNLPVCHCCKQRIQQERAICIDGKWFCEDDEDEAWDLIRKDYLEDVA